MKTVLGIAIVSIQIACFGENHLLKIDPKDLPHAGDMVILTTNNLTVMMFDRNSSNVGAFFHPGDAAVVFTELGIRSFVVTPEPVVPAPKLWYDKVPSFVWELAVAVLAAISLKIAHNLYKHPLHLRHLLDDEEEEDEKDVKLAQAYDGAIWDSNGKCVRPATQPAPPVEIKNAGVIRETVAPAVERIEKHVVGKITDRAEKELMQLLDTPIGKQ